METKTKAKTKARIVVINDPYRTNAGVAIHAVGCRGIRDDVYQKFAPPAVHWAETTERTPEEWAEDYNADFVAEGGPEAAWDIKFHNCARKVMNKS